MTDNRALWELVEKWRSVDYIGTSKRAREFLEIGRRHADELAAILERPVVVGGWLPIESAPKDGAIVDLWVASKQRFSEKTIHYRIADAKFCRPEDDSLADECWCSWQYKYDEECLVAISETPTHWMPLPVAPETNESMVRGKS
jgi:hypothetical protein